MVFEGNYIGIPMKPMKPPQIREGENSFILEYPQSQSRVKILQITDLHFYYGIVFFKNLRITREIRKMCDHFGVDLVINTGDFWGEHVPLFYINYLIKMGSRVLGRPWAFAWGNHDLQNLKRGRWMEKFDRIEELLESDTNCLYKQSRRYIENFGSSAIGDSPTEAECYLPYLAGDSTLDPKKFDPFYGGNYKIRIQNSHNSSPAWDLFILNSRQSRHVPPKALEWMESELTKDGGDNPALLFYHVPDFAYREILDNRTAKGIYREKVCNGREHGIFHEFIRRFKNIKATFVGHDHVNDYHANLDGIEVIYGRKTGTNGYGGVYKRGLKRRMAKKEGKAIPWGAKLITLDLSGDRPLNQAFSHRSVLHDLTTWEYPDTLQIRESLRKELEMEKGD